MTIAYKEEALLFGYDPGGNDKHGFCAAILEQSKIRQLKIWTPKTAVEVLEHIRSYRSGSRKELPVILGVDTLTCWSLDKSGQRHADRLLRNNYSRVAGSVIHPNALYGAMTLNGMAVILKCREECSETGLTICETHPKVLYHALTEEKYDFQGNRDCMIDCLANLFKAAMKEEALKKEVCNIKNDHEFDAALSLLAAWKHAIGEWTTDLHQGADKDRHVFPCGKTCFPWPANLDNCS